jgi:phosphohistidine phosphatase SixA
MDLILWRHAEAEEGEGMDDLERALTARGEKQAARVGAWIDRLLPEGARVLCSPARRCEQTALALGRKYKLRTELAPEGTPEQLLEAAQWPHAGPAARQLPGAQGRGLVDPHARTRRAPADRGGGGAVARRALVRHPNAAL